MRFQTPLIEARLIRRYKRFLADMELDDGQVVTAHCANPGSMLGMADPGARCWLMGTADPRKKLGWSWKLVEAGGLAVVDTAIANRVVAEALNTRAVSGLGPYAAIRAEVPFGQGSRVDFLLEGATRTHLEVKSVTLKRGAWAEFPDSVTARGTRHLQELAALARAGQRAVLLFLISRDDCTQVRVAADIDPAYAAAFDAARADGVEVMALGTRISPEGVEAAGPIPVDPGLQATRGASGQGGGL